MAMIHATELENHRVLPTDRAVGSAGEGGSIANDRLRTHRTRSYIAGLALGAVIGGVIFAWGIGQRQPPVIAPDNLLGSARTTDGPVEAPLAADERAALGPAGDEGRQTTQGDIGTSPIAEHSEDGTVAVPVVEQPTEKPRSATETPGSAMETPGSAMDTPGSAMDTPGSAMDTQGERAANDQTSAEPMPSDPIAPAIDRGTKRQVPQDEPSPPPPAGEAGPTIDGAADPVAIRSARTTSGVNMRVGPSNGQAVLVAIPGGSRVQVINCRQWCEVIFAGQRGWVYKGFIEMSPVPRQP
ncbi:MAG: SH3 domain-containing protein [Hyphomicrobiaceae bacterium]|nr:SH3 domain-containing protein [Hyphomicrobiaceae bacterium]